MVDLWPTAWRDVLCTKSNITLIKPSSPPLLPHYHQHRHWYLSVKAANGSARVAALLHAHVDWTCLRCESWTVWITNSHSFIAGMYPESGTQSCGTYVPSKPPKPLVATQVAFFLALKAKALKNTPSQQQKKAKDIKTESMTAEFSSTIAYAKRAAHAHILASG